VPSYEEGKLYEFALSVNEKARTRLEIMVVVHVFRSTKLKLIHSFGSYLYR
jgi:hypothetical protein